MSIKSKYEEFYSQLVDKLPMRDAKFMASLTSAGLFAGGNLKDEVIAQSTPADKATHFLDNAISPYIEDDDVDLEPLYKLLKAMEKHGGVAKRLADKIKTAIPYTGAGASSNTSRASVYDGIIKTVMKNYQALTTLNADAVVVGLYQRDVITSEEKEIIEGISLRSKKMEYIIDKIIIPSLKAEIIKKFKNFLEAMEDSEDTTVKDVGSRLGHSSNFL